MTSVVVESTATTPARSGEDDELVDVTVQKLKLVSILNKAGVDVDVTAVIADGSLEDTIDGAPQLVLSILDRGYELLQSGVFGQTVDIELDRVPFRLAEVDLTDVETLQLTFEHKIIALLRKQKKSLKASRDTVTRAQFIEMMLREIADQVEITYVCPEVNVVQPVTGTSKTTGRSLTSKTLSGSSATTSKSTTKRAQGFATRQLTIKNWDGSSLVLGPSELGNMATVLNVALQLNAPKKAVLAMVEACIVETGCTNPGCTNDGTGHYSIGILQRGGGGPGSCPADGQNIAVSAEGFLTHGYWKGTGAIQYARQQPGWSAGHIAQQCQGSAFPQRYDQAQQGAETIINAFGAGSLFSSGGGLSLGTTKAATYEFSRGQPGQSEDSWTCGQRLAKEVNWRLFIAGRSSVYFVTDDDLLKAAASYKVEPDTPGILKLTFQAEVGGRTVVVHNKRQPKPSEAELDARFDRWEAPSGAVIEIASYGVGDGDWIATTVDRPLFDASGTVQLQTPQAALEEPAASSSTGPAAVTSVGGVKVPGTGSPIDRVYAAATAIDRQDRTYVWGGGHGSWSQASSASGLDCSSSTSLALYKAGLMSNFSGPIASWQFASWGRPGRGTQMTVWFNNNHVFIEFYGRPAKRFDTVPGGSGPNGPHLRYSAPSEALPTFQARHWPGA